MKKVYHWLREHILLCTALGLLAFIPLYPKFPLLDIVSTWVYIRLEDFLVALAVVFLGSSVVISKGKSLRTPLTIPIVSYWLVGLISLIFAVVFLGKSIPNFFPHLALLHYLRRIEYMVVFFVAFLAIVHKPARLKYVIWVLVVTVIAITVYGVGQKFLGWPAFLTMNEEFAKGLPLRLPPTARIPSTFGGHYDLAAYLVLVIPILGSLALGVKRWWQKGFLFLVAVAGYVLLLFTASRISFGVYLVAISVMLIWQRKYLLIVPVIVLSFVLLNFVSGTADRFYKTLRYSDVIVDLSTGKPIGTLDKLEGGSAVVQTPESPAKESLPTGSEFINLPVKTSTNTDTIKTIEIYTNKDLATGSGEVATISGSFLVQKALVYDISITTRFQGQWPRAMEAFRRNVLLGSGYSSLSVAVDGNYHRMLGETGIIGAIAYLGILAYAFALFKYAKSELDTQSRAFVIGVFAGIVGLALNAILIDVFDASKVAFSMWLLLGVAVAVLSVKTYPVSYFKFLKYVFFHPVAFVFYLFLLIFIVYSSSLSHYFIGDDYTWLRWAAQSTANDIGRYFTHAEGFFYRPVTKFVFFALFSVFWLKPFGYHLVSLLLVFLTSVCVYGLLRLHSVRRSLAWSLSAVFSILAIHHENVFWISGLSSLLAAASLFSSLVLIRLSSGRRLINRLILSILAVCFLSISMFSYDGLLIAPVIVAIFMVFSNRKHWMPAILILLLIPAYWFMRSNAQALLPSGDYGYNVAALLPNIMANGVGYAGGVVVGPKIIEYLGYLREGLRSEKVMFTNIAVAMGLVVTVFLVWKRNLLLRTGKVWIWFVFMGIALTPYLGLGNTTERYAFLASGFFVVGTGMFFEELLRKYKSGIVLVLLLVGLVVIGIWNISETRRISDEWKKASTISEQTLLAIRKGYFPLREPTFFAFVNPPIRYGRAWIFPTGLTDALWHMFREGAYVISIFPTVEEAMNYPAPKLAREVLTFDNYVLKRVIREVLPVSEPPKGK